MACITHVSALGEKYCRVCGQEVPCEPLPLSTKPNVGSAIDEYRAALNHFEQVERDHEAMRERHRVEQARSQRETGEAYDRVVAAKNDLDASLRNP